MHEHLVDALLKIQEARDHCADATVYPEYPNGPGPDQAFDDWAADVASEALKVECRTGPAIMFADEAWDTMVTHLGWMRSFNVQVHAKGYDAPFDATLMGTAIRMDEEHGFEMWGVLLSPLDEYGDITEEPVRWVSLAALRSLYLY